MWRRSAQRLPRLANRLCRDPSVVSEQRRIDLLRGPVFRLRRSIDTSVLKADGTLVRSHRLARLEAALFITRSASAARLAKLARLVDAAEVRQLTSLLNDHYDQSRSAFRIEQTAGGYQLLTRESLASWLHRLHQRQDRMKLSQPAQETLTIVAYLQPVTRADVEAVRGVQSTDLIRQLIDRGLIRVAGEDDSLGRPFLYATTKAFLDMFGLGRLEDLPDYESLRRKAAAAEVEEPTLEAPDDAEEDDEELDEDDVEEEDDELLTEEESLDSEDQSEAA